MGPTQAGFLISFNGSSRRYKLNKQNNRTSYHDSQPYILIFSLCTRSNVGIIWKLNLSLGKVKDALITGSQNAPISNYDFIISALIVAIVHAGSYIHSSQANAHS